jgi:ubiquitin carboxyl-terminal hydrolase 22/27/51
VESENGYILCHECRDFVYDPTFEAIRSASVSRKRKYSIFTEPGDKRLVATNSGTIPCAATGLRGLYNMGQTCFMSVILQALIHNPFVRTYYLSEGHRSSECEREACTSCALDDIFTEFYGQEKHEGYGAVHMLQGCWKNGGNLAGYSQQDAHEYLGFILNSLHTANTGEDDEEVSTPARAKDAKTCDCIVHQTFAGILKSTVTCAACKNTTATYDPFVDLSLDIKSAAVSVKKKKLSMINGTTTVKEVLPMDLTECLDRFTAPETLSSDSYHCRKCNSAQKAEKRLKLSSLPPVLPVHLKRFSHSQKNSTSSKIDTKIRFPFTLNLDPYTSPPKQPKSNTTTNNDEDTSKKSKSKEKDKEKEKEKEAKAAAAAEAAKIEPLYTLSSVIVHKGKIDSGHYVSYARQGEEWFRFDDSMVVRVDEKEVLGAEAYMLFYCVDGV